MGVASPWSTPYQWTPAAGSGGPQSCERWHSPSPRRPSVQDADHTPRVVTSLQSSTSMKNRSNRDMMGAPMFRFCCGCSHAHHITSGSAHHNTLLTFSDLLLSYLPPMGLAAASMEVRALSVALTPALVMEIVCCSMASWMAT